MATRSVPVRDGAEFIATVQWYQVQGYALTWYAAGGATLVHSTSISCVAVVLLLVVGWLFLWIPLFVYLIWFAFNHEDMVSVFVLSPLPLLPPNPGELSADGQWRWDGNGWQSNAIIPAAAE